MRKRIIRIIPGTPHSPLADDYPFVIIVRYCSCEQLCLLAFCCSVFAVHELISRWISARLITEDEQLTIIEQIGKECPELPQAKPESPNKVERVRMPEGNRVADTFRALIRTEDSDPLATVSAFIDLVEAHQDHPEDAEEVLKATDC